MNELIHIEQSQIGTENVNSVNARDLHEKLELKSDFSTWIKKELSIFIEGVDFIRLHKKMEANNATLIEYFITFDTAKHLSMMQRNEKGKQFRDYFIAVEKQYYKPMTQIEITAQNAIALVEQQKTIDIHSSKIEIVEAYIDDDKKNRSVSYQQEKALRDAKMRKVYELGEDNKELITALHRKVWSVFYREFYIPRYGALPAVKFEDGLSFIRDLSIADMV